MCQAHHSVVETRSASFHLSGLGNACNLFPCNAMDVSSPPLCSRDKICISWSRQAANFCMQHVQLVISLEIHLFSNKLLASEPDVSIYTCTSVFQKHLPTSAHKIPSKQSHCTINWSVQWVWPCMASEVDPHLLTKFQVIKLTAHLIEVCSEFDHVWWSHCTLNWSAQWVWPCMSLEEHQE